MRWWEYHLIFWKQKYFESWKKSKIKAFNYFNPTSRQWQSKRTSQRRKRATDREMMGWWYHEKYWFWYFGSIRFLRKDQHQTPHKTAIFWNNSVVCIKRLPLSKYSFLYKKLQIGWALKVSQKSTHPSTQNFLRVSYFSTRKYLVI